MAQPTVLELLQKASAWLESRQVPNHRREADDLLAHVLKLKRFDLYLQTDRPIDNAEVLLYRDLIQRRGRREPLAYLLGTAAFHKYDFLVGPGVLIPRPETELLVTHTLAEITASTSDPPLLLDICTGTGCIPLSIAAECPKLRAVGVDISDDALNFARANLRRLHLDERVAFVKSDLVTSVPARFKGRFDVITSNPPYLTDLEMAELQPEVQHEPTLALAGGTDGLRFYLDLGEQVMPWLKPQGQLLVEIGPHQADAIVACWQNLGWVDVQVVCEQVVIDRQRVSRPRVVTARRPAQVNPNN